LLLELLGELKCIGCKAFCDVRPAGNVVVGKWLGMSVFINMNSKTKFFYANYLSNITFAKEKDSIVGID
jgi:hypothetical protein